MYGNPYVRGLLRSMPTRKVSVMRRGLPRPPKYVGGGGKNPASLYIYIMILSNIYQNTRFGRHYRVSALF